MYLCVRGGNGGNEWRLYTFLTLDVYLCVREGMVVMSGGYTPSLHYMCICVLGREWW